MINMKKIILLLLTIITLKSAFGQKDRLGNPVFNSEVISEEKFDKFELTSSYYLIDNNISNRESSVYVSEKPTLIEYLKFSRELPSYGFVIHQGGDVLYMIILIQEIEGSNTTLSYNIVNPSNGKSLKVPCSVWGEISEKRADELLKLKIDSSSGTIDFPNNGKGFIFGGIAYRVQPYDRLKVEVIDIAKKLMSQQ